MDSKFFLLVGPSGVGKTTYLKSLVDKYPFLKFQTSYTTRSPRPGEVDKIDYNFVDEDVFLELFNNDMFLEIDRPHNTYFYGLPKKEVLESLESGISIIKEIGIKGLKQLQNSIVNKSIISIFIMPYNLEILQKRLVGRKDTVNMDERLKTAVTEIEQAGICDYIVADKLGYAQTFNSLCAIIDKFA